MSMNHARSWALLVGALASAACATSNDPVFPMSEESGAGGSAGRGGAGAGGGDIGLGGSLMMGGAGSGGSGGASFGASGATGVAGSLGGGGAGGAGGHAATGGRGAGGATTHGGSGGAAGFGGAQTAGTGGIANSGPCANPVDIAGTNTENFGTMGPACFRTKTVITGGWNCSDTDGRIIKINGHVLQCGFMPVPPQIDGYTYIEATAGTYTWAQVYWWT